jgi:carbonic anhydrase
MRTLFDGVAQYEATKRTRYSARFAALASGQNPLALFITCVDSRVVPSLIALSDPGELFVLRNIGNLVPRSVHGSVENGDDSVSSAVFYALEVLGIQDVVVCGHSDCGGMKAALAPTRPRELERWLAPTSRAVERLRARGPLDRSLPKHDQLSQLSTLQQLENLQTHDPVRARTQSGDLRLHAWWFDIARGQLLAYSKAARSFIPAVETAELLSASAAE